MRARVVSLALAIFSPMLVAACSDPASPEKDLLLTASVTPAVFRIGEQVAVTVAVANRGTRSWGIYPACGLFLVMNQDDQVVGPRPAICTADIKPPLMLAPGEARAFRATWSGDSLIFVTPPRWLPPGTYRIRGNVGGPRGSLPTQPATVRIAP